MAEKMKYEDFVKNNIVGLREEGYLGIHTLYSGFNEAFKKYYKGENPNEVLDKLSQGGKIIMIPVETGYMLYMPEDAPLTKQKADKLGYVEFIKKAILRLRKEGFTGLHTVDSGFNEEFKEYYDGEDPVKVTTQLSQEGKIVIKPVKGDVMLYLPEDWAAFQKRMSEKIGYEDFVRKAIVSLRKEGYKGIHTVYCGFNKAFTKYYDGENPDEVLDKLSKEDKIVMLTVKGGFMLYLPEDAAAIERKEMELRESPEAKSYLKKMRELKQMHNEGLISDIEYETKKKEILSRM